MSLTEVSRSAPSQVDTGSGLSHRAIDPSHRRDVRNHSKSEVAYADRLSEYLPLKSRMDRIFGFILFVLASPLILVLAMIVRLTSTGEAIYRQTRVGKDGKTFELLKLRSMVRDAEAPGNPVWCSVNDLRITRVGRILRKLHLDELPQLWNVAKGEMSLVGPRPERPEICRNLVDEIDDYHSRHRVKPGITGLSQINLPADQTIEDVRRKQILDLRYIEEANLWLDVRMIMATALRTVGVSGENVIKLMSLSRLEYLQEQEASNHYQNRETKHTFESVQSAESPRYPR